jgi:hypothetical protein
MGHAECEGVSLETSVTTTNIRCVTTLKGEDQKCI